MPGIHLYSSNRLEILADLFAELLQGSPLPPLHKETVLIQSRGMARWLAIETADRLKIWANCYCPFPNTFIREIYKLLLPEIPDANSFDKNLVLWHLMDIFPEILHSPQFEKVAAYLESGDDLKLYQLAYETADLFDQYTVFRPRMILDWEENSQAVAAEHAWQSMTWCRLIDRLNRQQFPVNHRARLLQLFSEKLQTAEFAKTSLPARISVFGISSLPPYHLKVLAGLAHHLEVHFFIMNPCREYWFDIIADRDIVKISRHDDTEPDTLHLQQGNRLLASMGHLGRDFMAMLQEIYFEEHEFFMDPGRASLLTCLQSDILYLNENGASFSFSPQHNEKTIASGDTSVSFHSCHSPMREVEVLHDQLLALFDSTIPDKPIAPGDILVMAPDINVYAPLIRAVFDADTVSRKKIPYAISDQSIRKTSKYIETFFEILMLPQSRFSSIDMLGIIGTEPVRRRFGILETDLATIESWIRETRICWGIDQEHKVSLQLPPYSENTWRNGLDRLLLGYAMPGREQILFKDILPYDGIEGDNANLLGNFLDCLASLFDQVELLKNLHCLAEWSSILLQTKEKLMLADEDYEAEDRILSRLLYSLQEQQDRTLFTGKVSIRVIRSFLSSSLDEQFAHDTGETGFLTGGVTCCSMLPMRAIPFKVICLLGMNDGLYPRSGHKKSFDLMSSEPKRGDRSRRYDDRYLFLETILSARQKLSISFVGQSIQDGTKRPPSVLVSELMDYIDRYYNRIADSDEPASALSDDLTTLHRLQPFHHDYFTPQPDNRPKNLFSYSAENCEAALAISSGERHIHTLFSAPLSEPPEKYKQLTLSELISFFSHPARYLMLKIIGIAPIDEKQGLETSEPFVLAGLTRYKLENDILAHLLTDGDCETLYQVKKAAGELPHGKMGKIHFQQLVAELREFHGTLAELIAGQDFKQQQVNLKIGDFTISGHLDNVGSLGQLQYRYAKMKPKDIIRSWISHLVLNCLAGQDTSESGKFTYYAAKDGIFKYTVPTESNRHIERLLEIYWQGLTGPLCFFPGTSFIYAQEKHKGHNAQEALGRAMVEWEGNNYNRPGEKNDPYNLLCCKTVDLSDPLFSQLAGEIFETALQHQEKYL